MFYSGAGKSLTQPRDFPNDGRALRFLAAVLILAWPCFAQDTTPPPDEDSFWSRFWISAQANFIRQQHDAFDAKYSGPNSFSADKEHATSRVETLYTGFQIASQLEILADVESAGGAGLSRALGIA